MDTHHSPAPDVQVTSGAEGQMSRDSRRPLGEQSAIPSGEYLACGGRGRNVGRATTKVAVRPDCPQYPLYAIGVGRSRIVP